MKTIKEGIRHCIECLKYLSNYPPYEPESVEHGFVQGVDFPGTIVNMKFNFDDTKNYFMTCEKENINLNDLL